MKVLKVSKIQEWDQYTIQNEPIPSIDLMERASQVFCSWFIEKVKVPEGILILVSKGNNGGDGLAVARLLADQGYNIEVWVLEIQKNATPDFAINLERLRFKQVSVKHILPDDIVPDLDGVKYIIDGIFGSGLTRKIEGYWAGIIEALNETLLPVYSIDIPSGMFADGETPKEAAVINATHCLSFEAAKFAFFLSSNEKRLQSWEVRSIGLHPDFPDALHAKNSVLTQNFVLSKIKKRGRFDHKGMFGKALIAAGQKGMGGAAVLSVSACVRSGAGLVYALIPDCNNLVLQSTVPEAMTILGYGDDFISVSPPLEEYSSVGIGPGIGTRSETLGFLEQALSNYDKPMVLDADALNIISGNKDLFEIIPKDSILTPHPGEFKRLFGDTGSDESRINLARKKSVEHEVIIVLKGGHTVIALPSGDVFFNTTGNPGMATGGSGDVLTGLMTGLLAQGYEPKDAACMAVFFHGHAGDLASKMKGEAGLSASDLIQWIPVALNISNNFNREINI